ncbi:DUF2141 domain-containing protein [Zunongwangia sp. F363]|uniref:DUF2141 domain-containing protein n=1 Tax=Autumnicola tepida TaxID=3075595 RepID=A0ABU3CEZ3_9FLAO|nr:DUF2141 domain-containing protein [Zunongwangia sp. F363]MDT0644818.1 DUF2141 domain-containing protein [Zunongwangia sp. F363]
MAFFLGLLSITLLIFLFARLLWKKESVDFWTAGRWAMTVMMIQTGFIHLINPDSLVYMIRDILPFPKQLILISGISEIILGLGLIWRRTRRLSAWLLIAQLIAMFPANINVAVNNLGAPGGLPSDPLYTWSRLLFQPVYIWWVYRTSIVSRGKSFIQISGLALLSLFLLSYDRSYSGYSCRVEVINLPEVSGTLYLGWYDREKDFTRISSSVYNKKVKVFSGTSITVDFEDLRPGIYAISMFYDTNGNGILDKNFIGIPMEPYGFSNNVRPALRAPTFQESRFSLINGSKIIIKLRD